MIGISAAALFGLVLIIASLSLFLTSKFKPELYQESDNIYAVIGIVCGILLVASYDLGAAMAFQQMLMIGSLITIMWQFIQVRAENKQLKGGGRGAGREASSRKGYTAQIDDEPAYAPAERRNRRNKDRFDRNNNEREDREEFSSRRATRELPEDRFAQTAPRRRLAEPARTEVGYLDRRQNESWDEEDWNDANDSGEPVQVRRALPDADLASTQSQRQSPRRRSDRPVGVGEASRREAYLKDNLDEPPQREWDLTATADPDVNPRRRRRPERDPAEPARDRSATGQTGTTTNYIDYEPIDPPAGLPTSGPEPIVFPDRY
ncbi:Ycf66 family protein [Chamaesiphon sp. OTE_20_metabat_361]|uniref:Ycf66 family protein n=1 Tax=Chamaesiphon sp. OTE_20_metabat_361 TaxID=2964689 RepID=UPI00286B13DF|nr:Ycf66 family protein [Chamaesiphon sp. OTE_20_metabat_361]